MKRHDHRLRLDGEILDSLRKTALFLKDRGIIDHLPDFGRAVDGRLLE